MAKQNRPSVQKREREMKKRERRLKKAAKAAERRAAPPPAEGETIAHADGKDDQTRLP